MVGRDGNPTLSRRRTVALAGGLAIGLPGCQGLLGSGSGDEPTESFEDGLGASIFEDASQAAVDPALSEGHATHGDRSLSLASDPGTSTSNRVRSGETWSGPRRYSVQLQPVEVGGGECSTGFGLSATDSGRRLLVASSGYHGATYVQEYDAAGEQIPAKRASLTDPLPEGTWSRVEFVVRESGVTVRVDDVARELEPTWPVTESALGVRLHANGWGNGHPITTAFDEFRTASL